MIAIDPATGAETTRIADDKEPLALLVFKIVRDPYVGHLTYFRIYSGQLRPVNRCITLTKAGQSALPPGAHVLDRREDIDAVHTGDIALRLV